MYSKTLRIGLTSFIGLAASLVLLLAMASTAGAQTTYSYIFDNGAGSNRWGIRQNWGINPALGSGVNDRVPAAYFEETGLINSGVTVNVDSAQTQLIAPGTSAPNSLLAAPAGVTVDGVTAPGNGSTLNIASGGSLTLMITFGTVSGVGYPLATPTAGTGNATLVNGGAITVQPGGTMTVQGNIVDTNGTLTVGGVGGAGGTVTASNLNQAAAGTVNLVGSASVTVANGSVLNGTTSITGPSVVFKTPSISMSNTSVFSPIITNNAVAGGGGHSVIDVIGGVSVNGTIRPQFQGGAAPHLGDTWTLWDSAHIQGDFAASDAGGAGAGLPTGLRYALTTTTVGSTRGVKGQMTVENFLSAVVNRDTGQITLSNTDTTLGPGVTITGYRLGSAGGTLKPSAFSPAFGGGNWQTANPSVNSLGELNPTSSSTVGLGAAFPVGNVFDPVRLETTFGTTPISDVTFTYSRSDGRTVNAPVTYTGTGLANTLVLQVDPTNGKAKIVNDSVFNDVQFDGYQVTSASGSLLASWNSFENQSVPGWQKTPASTGLLAELNPTSTTKLNAGQSTNTMTGLLKTVAAGGTQDLVFTFHVATVAGDYNRDGVVNAADYVIWRDTLGSISDLRANGDNTGASAGKIDAADLAVWKSNFGKVNGSVLGALTNGVLTGVVRYVSFAGSGGGALGSSAVPEPSSLFLLAMGGVAASVVHRRKRFAD